MKFNVGDELFNVGKIKAWSEMIYVRIDKVYRKKNKFNFKYRVVYSYYEKDKGIVIRDMGFTEDFINENFILETRASKLLYAK